MAGEKKKGKPSGKKQRGRLSTMAPWLLVIAGIILLARPVVMDWYYTWRAQEQIHEIVSVYNDMDDPARLENLAQARAFNARQVEQSYEEPAGGIWDYSIQLTYRSTPKSMMAWIDIPRIGSRLPIYHGTGEAELMAGVGHAAWSALPVGGVGTRCVLTAHSGMTGMRMFDDIRVLEPGDQFVLWALNEPYAYAVTDIEVVLPEEAVERCQAVPGKDLCTLVTCTPFGINTHRLLVTGMRCPYAGKETAGVEAYVNRRTIPLLAGIAVFGFLLLLMLLGLFRRRRMRVRVIRFRRKHANEARKVCDSQAEDLGGDEDTDRAFARLMYCDAYLERGVCYLLLDRNVCRGYAFAATDARTWRKDFAPWLEKIGELGGRYLGRAEREHELYERVADLYPAHMVVALEKGWTERGYDRLLVQAMLKRLRKEKVTGVVLLASAENERVAEFLSDMGFTLLDEATDDLTRAYCIRLVEPEGKGARKRSTGSAR